MADECDLPQDTVESVQKYLPVKSLVPFKSVCKPWYTLVTDPYFIKIHSHHFSQFPNTSSPQSHLIKHPTFDNILDDANPDYPVYIFLESCKGLVLLFYMTTSFSTQGIVLWNPATRKSKSLPRPSAAFGPAEMVSLGFGCDANGDDFKVVMIFCLKIMEMKAEVYSSKADSWTTIEMRGFDEFRMKNIRNNIIVNGNPYWVAYTTGDEKNKTAHTLLGFDATKMEFKIVPLPKEYAKEMLLVDWEGSLAMLVCVKKENDWLESIDVWMYNDDEQTWIRKLRFGAVVELQVDKCRACSRSGKILVGCRDGRVVLYDSKDKCVSVIELKKDGVGYSFIRIVAYEDSLAKVEGMTEAVVSDNDEDLAGALNPIQGFLLCTMKKRGEITCYYRLRS